MTGVREKFAGENASRDEPVTPPCGFSSTKSKTEPKPSLVMKPIIPFALLGALFAVGAANAQSSTTPVGYETLPVNSGFNFVSPRLHQSVVASGSFETVTATSATDTGVDFTAVLGASGASGTYILEIKDAAGVIQEVSTWSGDTINAADLSGITAPVNYSIRKSSTLASVFGATNAAGLAAGGGGSAGADQIWLWNGTGWSKYYYDNFAPPSFSTPAWVNADTATPVDPATVNLVYADSFAIVSASGNDVTVTGEVKTTQTEVTLASGFNFVGSVAPAGATLSTTFGATNSAGLAAGGGGSAGADQIWLWNGAGWDKYYYDNFAPPSFSSPAWVNASTATPVDPATVSMPSGYAIVATGAKSLTQGVPASYASL